MPQRYWLIKSEPETYSIDDLRRDGRTHWDGVRNYKARNYLRDEMRVGDLVLFYHSNANPPGVAGVARVCRAGYPDHTAWDPRDPHYDPKSDPDAPTWYMVDVEFVEAFPTFVPLDTLKRTPELAGMLVVQRGQRLSVQPVEPEHFKRIRAMGRARPRTPR